MFPKRTVTKTALDDLIDTVTRELAGHEANTEEYTKTVEQLAKLYAIQNDKKDRISKDTLLMVLANLLGIIVIVNQEHTHVVVSKALPFVGKFK